jgi:hypothetical protein
MRYNDGGDSSTRMKIRELDKYVTRNINPYEMHAFLCNKHEYMLSNLRILNDGSCYIRKPEDQESFLIALELYYEQQNEVDLPKLILKLCQKCFKTSHKFMPQEADNKNMRLVQFLLNTKPILEFSFKCVNNKIANKAAALEAIRFLFPDVYKFYVKDVFEKYQGEYRKFLAMKDQNHQESSSKKKDDDIYVKLFDCEILECNIEPNSKSESMNRIDYESLRIKDHSFDEKIKTHMFSTISNNLLQKNEGRSLTFTVNLRKKVLGNSLEEREGKNEYDLKTSDNQGKKYFEVVLICKNKNDAKNICGLKFIEIYSNKIFAIIWGKLMSMPYPEHANYDIFNDATYKKFKDDDDVLFANPDRDFDEMIADYDKKRATVTADDFEEESTDKSYMEDNILESKPLLMNPIMKPIEENKPKYDLSEETTESKVSTFYAKKKETIGPRVSVYSQVPSSNQSTSKQLWSLPDPTRKESEEEEKIELSCEEEDETSKIAKPRELSEDAEEDMPEGEYPLKVFYMEYLESVLRVELDQYCVPSPSKGQKVVLDGTSVDTFFFDEGFVKEVCRTLESSGVLLRQFTILQDEKTGSYKIRNIMDKRARGEAPTPLLMWDLLLRDQPHVKYPDALALGVFLVLEKWFSSLFKRVVENSLRAALGTLPHRKDSHLNSVRNPSRYLPNPRTANQTLDQDSSLSKTAFEIDSDCDGSKILIASKLGSVNNSMSKGNLSGSYDKTMASSYSHPNATNEESVQLIKEIEAFFLENNLISDSKEVTKWDIIKKDMEELMGDRFFSFAPGVEVYEIYYHWDLKEYRSSGRENHYSKLRKRDEFERMAKKHMDSEDMSSIVNQYIQTIYKEALSLNTLDQYTIFSIKQKRLIIIKAKTPNAKIAKKVSAMIVLRLLWKEFYFRCVEGDLACH